LFDPPADPPAFTSDPAARAEPPVPEPAATPTIAAVAATEALAAAAEPSGTSDPSDLLDVTQAGVFGSDMPGDIADDIEGDHTDEHTDATLVGAPAAWTPRYDVDDLGGLLDAKSPLLARAFRAAKASDNPSRPTNGEHATNDGGTAGQDEDEDEIF
jgi:hypothetical protein